MAITRITVASAIVALFSTVVWAEPPAPPRQPQSRPAQAPVKRVVPIAELTRPSLVTLKFENARALDVYESLFKQANAGAQMSLDLMGGDWEDVPAVTVDLQKVPFWTAFLALEKQTGVSVFDIGIPRMRLTALGAADEFREASVSGPFMVVAAGGVFVQELTVFVEPRIRVMSHALDVEFTEGVDTLGKPLKVLGSGRAGRRAPGARVHASEMDGNVFSFHLASRAPRGGRLRGAARATVLTGTETFELDKVSEAANVERRVGDERFMLNAMKVDPERWFLTLVAYGRELISGDFAVTTVDVVDAKGAALSSGFRGAENVHGGVAFHIVALQRPAGIGPPDKLRIVYPAETEEVEIPFDFDRPAEGAAPPAE